MRQIDPAAPGPADRAVNEAPSGAENYRIVQNSIDELAARLLDNVRELRMDNERFAPVIPNLVDRAVSELQSENQTGGMRNVLNAVKQDLTDRVDAQNTDRSYRTDTSTAPRSNRYISARA